MFIVCVHGRSTTEDGALCQVRVHGTQGRSATRNQIRGHEGAVVPILHVQSWTRAVSQCEYRLNKL